MEPGKERIAKYIARSGVCSRRQAEEKILQGAVSVNGQRIDTPAFFVSDTDKIVVDGHLVQPQEAVRLWLYHKPKGLMTTYKDPQGRPTVFEKLPADMPRVVSVGRLDLNSEGLLLLTNSGALAHKLEAPSQGWKRKYRVRIRGALTDEQIKQLQKGITVEGVRYAPALVEKDEQQGSGTNQWVTLTLTEGKNREIRKMMAHFHHPVSRLIRIAYGPFQLGLLPTGAVKEIPSKVIKEQISCVS
ncbi:MAG: rRNA pseudouridine synthase [Alphaproteobacteria bacterium]|nr:rRNA pseudouridine synthase [Alphaproteobacteria bacterium]